MVFNLVFNFENMTFIEIIQQTNKNQSDNLNEL